VITVGRGKRFPGVFLFFTLRGDKKISDHFARGLDK
jgi:hypothetical protein